MINNIFNARLRESIKFSGKKQTEIARYCNISRQCLTDYKSGKALPSLNVLYSLCLCLDISADYLLGLRDDI